LDSHVFQFDFLNDSFDKLPDKLKEIIDDPEKKKKLIVYINPPYAEAGNQKMPMGGGDPKTGVSMENKTKSKYQMSIGSATNELSAQFMARVYYEIPNSNLALFSKLKFICAQNYIKFRDFFRATYKAGFVVRANTFDNVIGNFPISFTIWDLCTGQFPKSVVIDIPENSTTKSYGVGDNKYINQWIRSFENTNKDCIGLLICESSDFQKIHQPYLTLQSSIRESRQFFCNKTTLNLVSIYFSVRLCIEPTWLNDRDQFLYPTSDKYKEDTEFQNDCIVFTILHGQNRISVNDGINHWIPFTANEVKAKDSFKSNFMSEYIKNKQFSDEANAVLKAGRELWTYYHLKIANDHNAPLDASFYDIREYFQGRSESGTMKTKSANTQYNALIKALRQNLSALAEKIKPKVYEYGFLLE
jgi:hypothetical protein